ncbi:hypothetical protein BCR44DRAFT_1422665 [Catenaria anguillulae PL171]|uniref:Non-haem dioxygenase N-terminal domain-containing protein n=1 Tax=Catenaria anguillulae PL171 TaxID=765915 RepID=A0A1Y2I3B2_9FUNG|nr:hypothetical protein BCR44DRAFT_1422665 [Catenaria anguillulae PL171]
MVVPLALPVVDLGTYIADPTSPAAKAECAKAAEALKTYGALLVRDPRVPESANHEFLDMLEAYFEQPHDVKLQDVKPELSYQIGATPEFTEEPMCFRDAKLALLPSDRAVPEKSKYPALNAPPVVPKAFEDRWLKVMDGYGQQLHDAVELVAEVAAVGLGYEDPKAFVNKAKFGPHLLAPTGSDLARFNKLNTVFAGFHYDLNFLTIHGKSRYPGLHVWARNTGVKMSVAVPDGCLLVQAGKQIELLTGGTLAAVERAKAAGRSLWRVSSTLFYHIASDVVLKPTGPFDTPERNAEYPAVDCGEYVRKELELIALADPNATTRPSQ